MLKTVPEQIEKDIKQSNQCVDDVLENITDAFYSIDEKWRFIYLNRQAEILLGRAREEIIGKNVWKEFPEAVDSDFYKQFHKALGEGLVVTFEDFYPSLETWFEVRVVPSSNELSVYFRNIDKRKQAEEVLRENEELYRKFFNSIDQGFCLCEVLFDDAGKPFDYRFLDVNPVFERMTGISNDNAISGKTARELVPNLEEKWIEIYGRIVLTGESVRFVEGSDAMNRWFDVYAFRVGDTGSRTVAIFFSDVTEHKRSEQALLESENKYRMLVEQASDGIHTYDFQGNFIETNSKLCEMLGYTAEELLRHKVQDLIPPEELATNPIRFDELRTGKALLKERRLLRKDGTLVQVEISGRMIQEGLLQGIVRDITDRKRAEDALLSSERQLRLITDAIPLLISFVDNDQRYRFVNRAYTEWFGQSREEVVGKRLPEVLGEAAYKALLPEVERALSGVEVSFERLIPYKNGERFIHVDYIPEVDVSTGMITGFNAFVQDISESKKAEKMLRRSHKELENRVRERTKELEKTNEVLQVEITERRYAEAQRIKVLHQLVTVQEDERQRLARDLHDQLGQQLTALRLRLEMLRKSYAGNEELRRQIGEIQRAARELDEDVDFLAWQMRPTALDDLGIIAAIDHYVQQWSAHFNIPAVFSADRFGKSRLSGEAETNLYRIVQEALNNIAKHAEASKVNIFLEPRDNSAVLIIEDDGTGFDINEKYLFGNGMGLIGMKERAVLIDGTLELESAKGMGTTIYVKVPVIIHH